MFPLYNANCNGSIKACDKKTLSNLRLEATQPIYFNMSLEFTTMSDAVAFDFGSKSSVELKERREALQAERDAIDAEFQKRLTELQGLVGAPAAATKPKAKRGRKKTAAPAASADGAAQTAKQPTMKELVLNILSKNQGGLELGGILDVIKGMVERKEYATRAQKLAPVVSQAIHALKQEKLIEQNKDSKKYTNVSKVA